MSRSALRLAALFLAIAVSAPLLPAQAPAAKLDAFDLAQAHQMMQDAYKEVKKNYYDPSFHGVDLDARFHEYDARLNTCRTIGETFRIIAAFLGGLHDSHTFFIPPGRGASFETGYRMQMIGDKSIITDVKPKSDAAAKVHPGDAVLQFNTFNVDRKDIRDVRYFFDDLAPAPRSALVLQSPDGAMRNEIVDASISHAQRVRDLATNEGEEFWREVRGQENLYYQMRDRYETFDQGVIWKMSWFAIDPDGLDRIFHDANKRGGLVIDLRGNPGGAVDSLSWALGRLFDHDVKIAGLVSRKPEKPIMSRHSGTPYTGKLVVLIDDESASCAEVFARVIQLEHRGTVIGDRSPGYVMESQQHEDSQGTDRVISYGFSITRANLIMTDGKSLEGIGVTPDEIVLPTPADLAAGRDPVLARAAAIAGIPLTPEKAGTLFPYQWPVN